MNSTLDSAHTWFLERLDYRESLDVHLIEGIRASDLTDLEVLGRRLGEAYSIDVTSASRRAVARFADVLTFQVTNESYAIPSEGEVRTEGVLCVYSVSSFLNHVKGSTIVDALRSGEYVHYGLLLGDDIVVSISEPVVRILDSNDGPN